MTPMLDALFGNRSAAQTLLYLENYEEGYARAIAKTFGVSHTAIKRQLYRLEESGILVSRSIGNARVFTWNPRKSTIKLLRNFLDAELKKMPSDVTESYFRQRKRPRRTGKALL